MIFHILFFYKNNGNVVHKSFTMTLPEIFSSPKCQRQAKIRFVWIAYFASRNLHHDLQVSPNLERGFACVKITLKLVNIYEE